MKNRNINHSDNWATPPYFLKELNNRFDFNFDPCPLNHDLSKWDGLKIEWKERNFINPPYSRNLKELFVNKALQESKKGKLCVMLLPVSTSTDLFHNVIKPNANQIIFIHKRIPFIGINTKGQYVNWHLWDKEPPGNSVKIKSSGMHDSMLVIFDALEK